MKSKPSYSGDDITKLTKFLRECNEVIKDGAIADENAKKELVISYLDDEDLVEQWQTLSKYKEGEYKDWIAEIKELYPELEEDREYGSQRKLVTICKQMGGIGRTEIGRLMRFKLAFETEAAKLQSNSPVVTNQGLVKMVLESLDPIFADAVETAMNNFSIVAELGGNKEGLFKDVNMDIGRRGDKLSYQKVLDIAVLVARGWSGREANKTLQQHVKLEDTPVVLSRGSDSSSSSSLVFQREVLEKLNSFHGELAQVKDKIDVQEKQLEHSVRRVIETNYNDALRNMNASMNQSLRQKPEGREIHTAQESRTATARALACFFCLGPHMIKDCEWRQIYINCGWLVIDNQGYMKCGDGSAIPAGPPGSSRKDRIEAYYKKKGVTMEEAAKKMANMVQTFNLNHGAISKWDPEVMPQDDRVDHLYDVSLDQEQTMRIQTLIQNQPGMAQSTPSSYANTYSPVAQLPVTPQFYQAPTMSQPYQAPPHLAHPSQFFQQPTYSMQPQAQQASAQQLPVQTQAMYSPQPQSGLLDIGQVIQLMNSMKGMSTQGVSATEQLLTTRSGARSDPPAGNNAGFQ
jgi:hypothetical protein